MKLFIGDQLAKNAAQAEAFNNTNIVDQQIVSATDNIADVRMKINSLARFGMHGKKGVCFIDLHAWNEKNLQLLLKTFEEKMNHVQMSAHSLHSNLPVTIISRVHKVFIKDEPKTIPKEFLNLIIMSPPWPKHMIHKCAELQEKDYSICFQIFQEAIGINQNEEIKIYSDRSNYIKLFKSWKILENIYKEEKKYNLPKEVTALRAIMAIEYALK